MIRDYRPLFAVPVLSLLIGGGADAQSVPADRIYRFSIPAEDLDAALGQVSRLSGVQLLYDSGLVRGLETRPFQGDATVQAALTHVLAGTGLRARFTAGGSVVITRAATPDLTLDRLEVRASPVIGRPAPRPEDLAYAALIQRETLSRARENIAVMTGDYRIQVSFWVNDEGQLERAEAFGSSGDPTQDEAFLGAIAGLRLSAPPPRGLPEPVRVEFRVR